MKKISLIITLFVVLFSLNSCDDDNNTIKNALTASMSATIDGNSWTAVTRVTVRESGKFNITGTSIDGQVINLTTFSDSVKTYTLQPPTSMQFSGLYNPDATAPATDNYLATTGTVTITSIDETNKKVSGTFEFTGKKNLTESVSITNGTFSNLGYQEK